MAVKAMRRVVTVVGVLLVAAIVATYVRYHSFDPCDWIARDMAARTSLPVAVWEGRVRADFLLQGIAHPTPSDCVLAWWKERADGAAHP